MNNEEFEKKTNRNVCVNSNSTAAATAKNSRNKNCNSGSVGVGNCYRNSNSSSSNANGKNMSTKSMMAATKNSSNLNCTGMHKQQQMQMDSIGISSLASTNALKNQTLENLVNNCKLKSNLSSPTKSDTDTFSEIQPRVTDLSESDEESVSEILLACLCLRPDLLDDIPDSGSESHDDHDDEDDGDDEDEDEDDEVPENAEACSNFLLDTTNDSTRKIKALFEAAANEKAPVLRHATLAIDEATQALTKMRCANSPKDKTGFSRSLIAACTDNDVSTVRKLLCKGNVPVNQSTEDGESLLSMACSAGYYELAQVLLAMSAAQVEDKGQKDCTPLMEAASAGYVDIIRLLISHNADVNAQCATGNTPLMFACAGGHVEAVKELLCHGANVEDQNENGHTPLMEAASAGHVEVAKVLLESGAGINTHSNEFKESALTLACYKGHLNMVRFLLQAGADQEHKTDEMHTALMEASMDGHVEVARLLLDSGAQVNMPTDSFESPLTLAACGGHVELATLLIERGANIEEVNDEGYTPLMEAAREGHEDMVALLLAKGANINATTEETQETALTLACCGGFMEVAEFLIKQGADLELGASTPLMEAAQEGHTDLVRFLLENGANVHAQTQTGDTALTHACENGHTDAAEVLLYFGAELEHESEGGRTPLMKACRAGHICTVKFLISKGADVSKQTTSNDHTPLSLACAGGHQSVVELLLKNGADPFHKLKDNSTMLIEASKGGHIRVVEILFKYPHFIISHPVDTTTNVALNSNNNGQLQIQPINNIQQQPKQIPQLSAPPGLHEVPEAVRVSNQQIFHQQQFQSMDYLDEQIIASSTENFSLDSNAHNTQQQNDAIFGKMRLFQLQAGFEDGLAHGLAHSQPGVVNQIINQSNTNGNVQTNASTNINTNNSIQNTVSVVGKQKSLLRKNRQAPAPFELNLTSSEAQQVRTPPLGEDGNPLYLSSNINSINDQQQQRRKIIEEFQKKANIQLVCDSSANSSTILPSGYVDITTASTQGIKSTEGNNSFILTTSPIPNFQVSTGGSISVTSSQTANSTTGNVISTLTPSPVTHITTPSEVSQSTAISDRPKVKPVSKKDGKNLRKAATVLQQNQMVSIYNNLPLLLATESTYQSHQQPLNNVNLSNQSLSTNTQSIHGFQQIPSVAASSQANSTIFQQASDLVTSSSTTSSSTSGSESTSSSVASSSIEQDDQMSKLALNTNWNRKMLQMVAQIPNHPIQKIAQRLIEQPKSPTETPPTSESEKTPGSPSKHNKFTPGHHQIIQSKIEMESDSDFVDISRALRDAVHDFRPDLNASEIVQVLQPISNVIPHKSGSVNNVQQQFTLQGKSQHTQGIYMTQNDDHFRIFPADDSDSEPINDCGIYPALGESLEGFNTHDDGTREQICSYELGLGDCMEEFFNVFQGVNDPALQELATNLNCSEFAEFGISSYCKNRWNNQWMPPQQTQDLLSQTSPGGTNFCINDEQNDQTQANQIIIDHQLQQELHHRLSVEELQIFSQFQNQHQQTSLSLLPSTSVDQQQATNITLATQTGIQQQQQQTQTQQTNTTSNGSSILQQQVGGISQSQQSLNQQQQILSGEAQQQAKYVLNVDAEKPSQSLQLLFQIPPVQQQGQNQVPTPIIQHQQHISSQAIAQTQTAICQPIQKQLSSHTSVNLQQKSVLQQKQQQAQHCSQHSQVQVATQTQQPSSSVGMMSSSGVTNQFCPSAQTCLDGGNVVVQTQQQNQTPLKTGSASGATKKPADKASRKERNRYTVMRQGPTGGSQANTTQQYSAQGTSTGTERVIDVDSETDSNHDTALTLACAGGHEELVELLINRGANIEHRDKKGFTPLILAATAGHEKVVDILLKQGADLEAQSERTKDTPLSLACSGGRYEVVELLLSVGANKEHRNVSDYTPLSLAASGGYVNIIKLLLNHGAEINSRTGSKLGISPLMLAAMNGHTAAVKLLLDMGSDINAQIETNRNTALTLACFQGRHEVVSLLLDRKANVEHRAKTGLTPLMEAASGGYIEVGRVLLDKGADVNAAPVPTSRDTALTIAADKGHLKFVELLLARGAIVEVKNKKGNSPLWLAANGGHLSVVEVLSREHADIDSQDNRKVSCLMAAFRRGHTKVVKWMVQHVTQFPSEQEMSRFINTLSEKELNDKCYECVNIIHAAKEAQAVKANKNASILLEELDMEKTREENRRAAAARRRERKKKKKLEKKEERRKMLEGNNVEPNIEKESEKEDDSDKDELNAELNQNQDREEGDSGIDHCSCSSNDAKATNIQTDKSNKAKSKKKKNNTNTNNNSVNRTTNSPVTIATDEKTSTKKKEDVHQNKAKKDTVPKIEHKKSFDKVEENKKDDIKKKEILVKENSNKNKTKEKEKENLAPKEENIPKHISKPIERKTEILNNSNQKSNIENIIPPSTSITGNGNRRSLIFSARHSVDKDENNISKHHRHHDDNKINSSKPITVGVAKRGEDGWKEVVRKSSIQQSTITSSAATEMTCKKVQVPVHAISRVIGRAGSNINAIRATTGAHIEVEKQGKSQSDRSITIKGLADATKQAHFLITTLIKDPDVDILQMLTRSNPSTKPAPLVVNSWDKNNPLTVQQTTTITSTSTLSTVSTNKCTKPIQCFGSVLSTSKSLTTVSNPTSIKQTTAPMSRAPGSKPGFIPATNIRLSSTIPINVQNNKTIDSNIIQKRLLPSTTGTSHSETLINGTKTTMSYTNAIMSLKNAPPKSSGLPSNGLSSQPAGTFASKLNSSGEKTVVNNSLSSNQNQLLNYQTSPKHNATNFYDVGNLLSFGPSRKTMINSLNNGMLKGVISSTTYTSTIDTNTNTVKTNTRPITPIGPPNSSNRNITSSPLLHSISNNNNNNEIVTTSSVQCVSGNNSLGMQPSGLVSQLQTKISNEYSLFNDTYSSQWESAQIYNSKSNDLLPKADASKAPGYNRGNVLSSPVSSKACSNSTTPPSTILQTQCSSAQQHLTIHNATGVVPSAQPNVSHAASQNNMSGANEIYVQSTNDMNSVLKTATQSMNSVHSAASSGLAVQRPVANNNNTLQNRVLGSQIDSYGAIGSTPQNREPNQNSRSYFDQITNQGLNQNHALNYSDSIQQEYHQHMNATQNNPLQMSRLNPRASVFSQQSKSSQQLSGMFHQNNGGNMTINNFQKHPAVGTQNFNGNNAVQNYNPNPGRPQSQPQSSSNTRWFTNSSDYNYMPSSREILNLDNNLSIGSASPTMSPNNPQPQTNGVISHQANQGPSIQDDSRKIPPRPIGTERASWKYNNYPNMNNVQPDISNGGTLPPWMMDKQPQTQQIQQNWSKSHSRYYVSDVHPQDHFHVPIDYHHSMAPHSAATIGMMPTIQYPHYMAPSDITQMQDKIESWEPEKHGGWSTNWTN